ncbi:DUF3310 domain-containing protein [Staphylococcus hominis]|uniref:DUF3310 domain-containing protein n=1 Tax=Staphylococcus hominis TaxID=1290 RepID=UPI001F40A125|nr:DUF3310 domain-containing protein [Staphylococcus hominis]MCE4976563.1 DUF3310 domain-containing protein [Staphylococcus hominis]
MENVRVAELNKNDVVQFQCANKKFSAFQTAIVNQVHAEKKRLKLIWKAEVENQAGYKFILTDNDDFMKVDEPFTRKVDMQEEQDVVNKPKHYTYGDIEVIDYCDQVCKQYSPELAPYVFNAIKYLSRANHKGGREDIGKAKYYVQRLFDKWEG